MPIARAINSRVEIEFEYDGHRRVVQPAALGSHATTGNYVLRGYQVAGSSSTRVPPLWDLFSVAKVQNLIVTDRKFDADPPGYARDDKHISPIEAQL